MRLLLTTLLLVLSIHQIHAQFDRGGKKINDGLNWGQWDGLAIAQTRQFKDDQVYLKNSHKFVQGSPYYDKTFKKAKVRYYDEEIPQDIYLRYNANTDELEMSSYQHNGATDQMLLPDENLTATFNNETYQYVRYYTKLNKKELLKGYFIILSKNKKYSLYLKKTQLFREAKEARTSLERSFPARFEEKLDYYVQIDSEPLLPIKNKSSKQLSKVFGKKVVKRVYNTIPSSQSETQFLTSFIEKLNLLNQ